MAQKPSTPKGTRDFLPLESLRRNYIFDCTREVFQQFGFLPIETPAMENLSTLLGKYGDEGDKLLFKILNSGDFLQNVQEDSLEKKNSIKLINQISEKGLRYDLTVPFARFVVQHQNEIELPFKRYQIQPVWRADKPQKGRYREFYQCDVDVVGSNSILSELELVQIIDAIFSRLKMGIILKINNRKILSGVAEYIGEGDKIVDITVAMDKMEKKGLENVNKELQEKKISQYAIDKLQPIFKLKGSNEEKLLQLKNILKDSEIGLHGIEELQSVLEYCKIMEISCPIELDLNLARGLSYYTGIIFEVKSSEMSIGSICGGGRYDNLTNIFGLKGISGVGVSFGADRIYDVLKQLEKFPSKLGVETKVMFVNFGKKEEIYCLKALCKIRKIGINAEIYPDIVKMKKQMSYADKKKIPFVVIAGEEELENNIFTLKDMSTGEQKTVTIEGLINFFYNFGK